jgi:DNA-nicking Smr family endonuclease
VSRKRLPTGEELRLWEKVTESIAPLTARKAAAAEEPVHPATIPPKPRKKAASPPPSVPHFTSPKPPALKHPALSPIDRRTRSRLTRGAVAIDARIDLHGMTQAAAHRRLSHFLHDAQADGAKVVLVITGKGRPASDGHGAERGVLRRMVPEWLSSAEHRSLVVGFDEASPSHGGGGALYVRIRRAR